MTLSKFPQHTWGLSAAQQCATAMLVEIINLERAGSSFLAFLYNGSKIPFFLKKLQ